MNELHVKFKSDTGKNAFIKFETILCIEYLDERILEEHNKKEIISFIEQSDNLWCITDEKLKDKIPSSNNEGDIKLHSDEYVQWLENKINNQL